MSRKYTAGQFTDPAGIIVEALARQGIFGFFAGVPTASINGYLPGSIAVDITNGNVYRNTGTITAATWVQMNAGVDLSGLLATAAEINRVAKPSTRFVSAGGAALTVTQALHDGKTILLNQATGTAVTLPAMSGSGSRFRFVLSVTTSGGSQVITATGAHLFGGVVQNNDTGAAGLFGVSMATNAGGSTVITLDGTTKGGRKGDWIEIEDVASGIGIVRGFLNASGTEATPFS